MNATDKPCGSCINGKIESRSADGKTTVQMKCPYCNGTGRR